MLTSETISMLKQFQQEEIDGHYIYAFLSKRDKNAENAQTFKKMADDELHHYQAYKHYTNTEIGRRRFKVFRYKLAAIILGPTFCVKLLEKNEVNAQKAYKSLEELPEIKQIIHDEEVHEAKLVAMIKEEKLNYMGSIVLGLNDALVELTGALAGLTLALRDPELIALTGSITGIAAAFSMAASEYLSTKSEDNGKGAIKAAVYTGIAYMFTVLFLILPFLLLKNVFVSLLLTLSAAVLIIAGFNYFYATVKNEKFSRRFIEMVALSFGVALLSFGVGFLLRRFTNIDV